MKQLYSRILLTILGWFGLASCDNPGGLEYGAPYARYYLDGQVINADTKEPIPGIQIAFEGDTTHTDSTAVWSIRTIGGLYSPDLRITAKDIDGIANGGSFEPAGVLINPTLIKPGRNKWDEGVYEQKNITIELIPAQNRANREEAE